MLWYAPGDIAHLMQWRAAGWQGPAGWESVCSYTAFVRSNHLDRVRTTNNHGLPAVPWCSRCTSWARRQVARLVDTGIIAEIPPGAVG